MAKKAKKIEEFEGFGDFKLSKKSEPVTKAKAVKKAPRKTVGRKKAASRGIMDDASIQAKARLDALQRRGPRPARLPANVEEQWANLHYAINVYLETKSAERLETLKTQLKAYDEKIRKTK